MRTSTPSDQASGPERLAEDPLAERLGAPAFRLGAWLLGTYLLTTILYRNSLGGIRIGTTAWLGLTVALALGLRWVVARRGAGRPRRSRLMLNAGLCATGLAVALVLADSVFTTARRPDLSGSLVTRLRAGRESDSKVWHGEAMPSRFLVQQGRYWLYKPNVTYSAESPGDFYHAGMLASRTLVDSVLEFRRHTYAIGATGLRELGSLAASRMFALGDSFVMGYGTDEDHRWTTVLSRELGEPVYNMGVANVGPPSEVNLLEAMLRQHRDSMRVATLLWMIFEGNDLENGYADRAAAIDPTPAGIRAGLNATVLGWIADLPRRIQDQSVLHRLLAGELTLSPGEPAVPADRYAFDGVQLTAPLFRSPRFGYQLFNPTEIERATKPERYVLNHPNRAAFERTMDRMKRLSVEHRFRVVVIVAPSSARLYGAEFEGFPQPSDRPYFAEYALSAAGARGFDTIDLVTLLKPFAARERLYYRDDHHWNERGNALAARLILTALTEAEIAPTP